MSKSRRALCAIYIAVAILALIGTWRQNLAFMADKGVGFFEGFAAFWTALLVNRATISITVDLFVFGLAALLWMVLEARRLGMRGVWLYFIFGLVIAISVTFPLFLAARERRLAALGATDTEPAPSTSDLGGLVVVGLAITALVVWCTLR
jgi:hypothetical protein